MTSHLSGIALAAFLAAASPVAWAQADQQQAGATVEFSKGLRGRISDGKLGKARLVFTDTELVVEVKGSTTERFGYEDLAVRRGKHHRGAPLLDPIFWLTTLPSVASTLTTGGLGDAAVYLAAALVGANGFYLAHRLLAHPHWLSLHLSNEHHRCTFVRLPRSKGARTAIAEEIARRAPRELRTRPRAGSPGLSVHSLPSPGELAPDFSLSGLQATDVRLSDLRGSVVLLNFWATWCGPCRQELPQLQRLHQQHSNAGLVVLGISDEKPDHTREFLAERGITYPSLHDEGSLVFRRYGVTAIPTTLVIGPDGVISFRFEGYLNRSAMAKALKPHLSPPAALKRR